MIKLGIRTLRAVEEVEYREAEETRDSQIDLNAESGESITGQENQFETITEKLDDTFSFDMENMFDFLTPVGGPVVIGSVLGFFFIVCIIMMAYMSLTKGGKTKKKLHR